MRVNKSQALLEIYRVLFEKKSFTKTEICEELELNDLQFHRYMQDMRDFFITFQPAYEVFYHKNTNTYVLEKLTDE